MSGIWRDGILGVVVGDALGCPVQFVERDTIAKSPVTGMRGHGTFNLPAGSWTDDSSLTIALLDSINKENAVDSQSIMSNFIEWLDNGKYTPYGFSYDIGAGTAQAIRAYKYSHNPMTCGGDDEYNNGNGSLMRIMPACLFCYEKGLDDDRAIDLIHSVGSLTHRHIRANIACGLYYFMAQAVLNRNHDSILKCLQNGLNKGFAYYEKTLKDTSELRHYKRLRDLLSFAKLPEWSIRSTGYVVDTLEAAVWVLETTFSYKSALLKAVNLGADTDTVGAVAGGLAGLFYGCCGDNGIPEEWINAIQRKDYIINMCDVADKRVDERLKMVFKIPNGAEGVSVSNGEIVVDKMSSFKVKEVDGDKVCLEKE